MCGDLQCSKIRKKSLEYSKKFSKKEKLWIHEFFENTSHLVNAEYRLTKLLILTPDNSLERTQWMMERVHNLNLLSKVKKTFLCRHISYAKNFKMSIMMDGYLRINLQVSIFRNIYAYNIFSLIWFCRISNSLPFRSVYDLSCGKKTIQFFQWWDRSTPDWNVILSILIS